MLLYIFVWIALDYYSTLSLLSLSLLIEHCPNLSLSPHLHVNTTATVVETVVGFSCDSGYQLQGDSYMVCRNSGDWSSDVPSCGTGQLHIFLETYSNSIENCIVQLDIGVWQCVKIFCGQ